MEQPRPEILGAIKRRLMGESIMMTYFRTQLAGEVGFAGHYPGKIHVFDLAQGQSIMVQRDGFLFAQSSVQLDIALVRKLGAGLLGGEGFILEKTDRTLVQSSYMRAAISRNLTCSRGAASGSNRPFCRF